MLKNRPKQGQKFSKSKKLLCLFIFWLLKRLVNKAKKSGRVNKAKQKWTKYFFFICFWIKWLFCYNLSYPHLKFWIFWILINFDPLLARDVLVMKKLEIEKTKPTFIISTFKTDILKVGLVFSISNFFIDKKCF